MTLKPWREVMKPHDDVISGEAKMADFAADLTQVVAGKAPQQYQNPALFFQYTYITEGTKQLLLNVARRISEKGGDPVIQLQTGFGGGKTHSMLAVYHMVRGEVSAEHLLGLNKILEAENLTHLPTCRTAVIDGVNLGPNSPKTVRLENGETLTVKTLWGVLAASLGGDTGYELLRTSDDSGTSPGKEVLIQLLEKFSPCVILIDELVAYVRQFNEEVSLLGGTFASNLSFLQALTEAVKCVSTAVLLASLPESVREVGSGQGERALEAVEHHFGRIQATWKPVDQEESFEIVRRRLFDDPINPEDREATCDAFCRMYAAEAAFPNRSREAAYRQRMLRSYPIHPEVFEQLYTQWTTLERFQKTRGVLKMMSNAIHDLWTQDNKELMVLPADLPLSDSKTQGLFTDPLDNTGWPNIIASDIDGERSEAARLDVTKYGRRPIARRMARTIFLATAPGTTNRRSLSFDHLLLGTLRCEEHPGMVKDALKDLCRVCHYLYKGEDDATWFSITPNLTSEIQSRRKKFLSDQQAMGEIQSLLAKALVSPIFRGVHVFAKSEDIPDDENLRLVVAPIDQTWAKDDELGVKHYAREILERRGSAQRSNRNRLIFLTCEPGQAHYLKEEVATLLACRSIQGDVGVGKLNIDTNSLKEVARQIKSLTATLFKLVSNSFMRVVAPTCTTGFRDLDWDDIKVQAGETPLGERVLDALIEEESLLTKWAPIHLSKKLEELYWSKGLNESRAEDFWQAACREMYMPRFTTKEVLREAIGNGTESFFGIAQGKKDDGSYAGVVFGKPSDPVFDSSLLLLEAETAKEALAAQLPSVNCRQIVDAICALAKNKWQAKSEFHVGEAVSALKSECPEWTDVLIQKAMALGIEQRIFGVAKGKYGDVYEGLVLGLRVVDMPALDWLLVNPAEIRNLSGTQGVVPPVRKDGVLESAPRNFSCTIEIPMEGLKGKLLKAVEAVDVILRPNIKVKIQLDISAESGSGFSEQQIRALKENLPLCGCDDEEFW